MKTLMVVPYYSSLTMPKYFQYLIDGYAYKNNNRPDFIDYVPNDVNLPQWRNLFDEKLIRSFLEHAPTEFIIGHASDTYLMPHDLDNMISELKADDDAFAAGIYPITNYVHTRMNENPICPTRIFVWKSDIFVECLEEHYKTKHTTDFDAIYKLAEIAVSKKYHCIISKSARPFPLFESEFKTMVIK